MLQEQNLCEIDWMLLHLMWSGIVSNSIILFIHIPIHLEMGVFAKVEISMEIIIIHDGYYGRSWLFGETAILVDLIDAPWISYHLSKFK